MVSDIPAGDRKIANFFYSVAVSSGTLDAADLQRFQEISRRMGRTDRRPTGQRISAEQQILAHNARDSQVKAKYKNSGQQAYLPCFLKTFLALNFKICAL